MEKKHTKSAFIFRRDLRLEDNTGLIEALKSSGEVMPCFILDPAQVHGNRYMSLNALQFMLESLDDLDKQLNEKNGRLYLFYGRPAEVVGKLDEIDAIYLNRDYTPFSRERDDAIRKVCERKKIPLLQFGDSLLNEPEAVLKENGRPYTVFTPYLRKAVNLEMKKPQVNRHMNYSAKQIDLKVKKDIYDKLLPEKNKDIRVHGGRRNALRILADLARFRDYNDERDYPALDATTHLSAHNKFGTCSIREVYYEIKGKLSLKHNLLTELYWRDFFTYIGFYFPRVFVGPFREKYGRVEWSYNRKGFEAWCQGSTGFPIVDAGMRELNNTGFMHNRVRMITASFLTKDMHINWRWGERYFAQKLLDYDPCVNNGNWQWAASTGCDSQPYFRVFNPWIQQKKYDPQCIYIKKWIPELRDLPPEEIHTLHMKRHGKLRDYPQPIVDHSVESKIAKAMLAEKR